MFPFGGIYDTQVSARVKMMWVDTVNLSSKSVSGSSLAIKRVRAKPDGGDQASL